MKTNKKTNIMLFFEQYKIENTTIQKQFKDYFYEVSKTDQNWTLVSAKEFFLTAPKSTYSLFFTIHETIDYNKLIANFYNYNTSLDYYYRNYKITTFGKLYITNALINTLKFWFSGQENNLKMYAIIVKYQNNILSLLHYCNDIRITNSKFLKTIKYHIIRKSFELLSIFNLNETDFPKNLYTQYTNYVETKNFKEYNLTMFNATKKTLLDLNTIIKKYEIIHECNFHIQLLKKAKKALLSKRELINDRKHFTKIQEESFKFIIENIRLCQMQKQTLIQQKKTKQEKTSKKTKNIKPKHQKKLKL